MNYRKYAEERFKHHMADGDTWIGIYENQALDSKNVGHRVALFFSNDQWDIAEIGSQAPDLRTGFPDWRYRLVYKARTVEDALANMNFEEEDNEDQT